MQDQKNKKAVIYCRVSTKEQAEEGNSLVTQEHNCRCYANEHGYDVAEVFIEEGESAKNADRTQLQRMLRFCAFKKNGISAVIAYKIDRISRNTDDYSQIRMLLKRHDVEIKSTSEYFEDTPAGRFMENIMANVAQFDNDVRTERSVGGMVTAMREGRYVWQAPTGYANRKVDGKSTIVKAESAPLIRMLFDFVASRAYSVEEVRKKMVPLGLCTKQGKPLAVSHIYRILRNEAYAGWIVKFGEKCRGSYEPIVSDELFGQVQRVLARHRTANPYHLENPDFPLRRFVRHARTGEKLTGSWSKGRRMRYAYYRYVHAYSQWKKDDLEKKFLSFMDSFSFNKDLLTMFKKHVSHSMKAKTEESRQGFDALEKLERELKEKRAALVEKSLNKIISDSVLKESLDLIESELWDVQKAKDEREGNSVDYSVILKYIENFLLCPSRTWKNATFETRLKLQWFVFPNGILLDNSEIRTTKVCSLFKAKDLFQPKNYPMVTNAVLITNTPSAVKSSPLPEDIKSSLMELGEILRVKGGQDS
ncbi:recombinase family protein [Parasediminibacterium sp. JCM 36343]|uniref:recombinase family protein n=1 Tax=Parasediminibacterium sp. JCM 36343 TaxID=3374279 RepID=UPI0039794921